MRGRVFVVFVDREYREGVCLRSRGEGFMFNIIIIITKT